MAASRIQAFDRLRAVAALSIAYYHIKLSGLDVPLFPGSPYGVDIFFILSGYVVTSAFLKLLPEFPPASRLRGRLVAARGALWEYGFRRVFRIWPLALVPLTLYAFANVTDFWIFSELKFPDFWKSLAAIFTLRFNYVFFRDPERFAQVSYFWTIVVEEHFYLLLPLFVLLFKDNRKRLLACAVGILFQRLVLLPAVSFFFPSDLLTTLNFYGTHGRIHEFLIGAALCFIQSGALGRRFQLRDYWSLVLSWSLILFLLALPSFEAEGPDRTSWIILAASTAIVHVGASSPRAISLGASLDRVLEYLGNRSFGIYLFHSPIIFILTAIEEKQQGILSHPVRTLAIYLVALIASAEIAYRAIEKPAMLFGRRLGSAIAQRNHARRGATP